MKAYTPDAEARLRRTTFLGLLSIAAVTVVVMACSSSREPALMTWSKYQKVRHVVPYVLDISSGNGRLVYVGSDHTNDPNALSIATIRTFWSRVQPDVTFNEGGAPPTAATEEETVRRYGEAGLVRFLAARDGVPVASLDPTKSQLAMRLNPKFGAELVKMGFLLTQVRHHRQNPTEPFEVRMRRTFAVLNQAPGLEGRPTNIEELAALFHAYFPDAGSFRDAPDAWFDPVNSANIMSELSRETNDERDRFMIELLVRHVRQGKRVFAVVGASHVVRQEAALRAALQ